MPRQLCIDGDGNIRHDIAEQAFANPFAAQDGVVVLIHRPRHQPRWLRQDAPRVPAGMVIGCSSVISIRRQAVGFMQQPLRS